MAEHWIEARDAARIVRSTDTLCKRAAAGMVRFRAQRVTIDGDVIENASLSEEFWSYDGRLALLEDWNTGDFLSSFDGLTEARAFGVQFYASDVLDILPFEERAGAARSLSVAGNPAWVSARDAWQFARSKAGSRRMTAGNVIVEQCRLGFIAGRAVEMRWAAGDSSDDRTTEAREWDVPMWFWKDFTTQDAGSQDWERGRFAGRGCGPEGYGWITLNGMYFLRSSLDVLLPTEAGHADRPERIAPSKAPLPEAELQRWWNAVAKVRDALTQEQLWVLATAAHSGHTVSRERIRALAPDRKRGRKTN